MKDDVQVRKFAGLLFDKDGTLFDFHATWGTWTHGFIHDLAKTPDRAEVLANAMQYDLEQQRYLPQSPFIAGSVQDWMDHILPVLPEYTREGLLSYINTATAQARQVPAAPLDDLLTGLRQDGYRLGVATNDGIEPVTRQLRDTAIHHHFEFVVGYDSGFGQKPGPGQLLAFADAIEADPAQIAMIGDSTHDLEAAVAAGMVPVAVLTGTASAPDLAPFADVVLPSIGDLPNWLANGKAAT